MFAVDVPRSEAVAREESVYTSQGSSVFMVRMTDCSQGTGGDDWDCLPQSLNWPVTQQVVAVVTEAATRNSAQLNAEIQF